jgi:hypothetical protein
MPGKEYYKKNPTEYSKQSTEYYYKNKEKILRRMAKKKITHPELKRASDHKYYLKYKADGRYLETSRKFRNSLSGKFLQYKSGAMNRNYIFELSKDDIEKFWQMPCHYCGSEIETVGLDRMDNSIGYTLSNIVPCCKKCNYMKKNMNYNEFIGHCIKIRDTSLLNGGERK